MPVIVAIALAAIVVTAISYNTREGENPISSAAAEQSTLTQQNESETVVFVKTAPLRRGLIAETLMSYGTIVPRTDQIRSFSVPFESVIEKVYVNAGQQVDLNELLLSIAASPDTRLQLEQARIDRAAAHKQEALVQIRLDLKLATRQDLVTTHQLFEQADKKLRNLVRRGVGTKHEIRADAPALVYLINVSQGQIVPAGTNLLNTIPQNQLIVRLGIEPEDLREVQTGQPVQIRPVHVPDAEPLAGQIELLTRALDPQTRLVNVLVKPDRSNGLLLNDYVEGEIVIRTQEGLLAPRQALLPDGNGYSLFTVQNGYATKHHVRKGLENATKAEVITNDLQDGERIVISGNYELDNGSVVREESVE